MDSKLRIALLLASLSTAGCNCGNDLFFGSNKHDGGVDLVEVPDSGHSVPTDRPEKLAPIVLDWLAQRGY